MDKRDLSLDLIRIIAILIILTYHFSLIYAPAYVLDYYGSIGTTLFFLISGYVIQLQHKKEGSIKDFYKKRFIALFPILWIAFIIAYVIHSIQLNNFNYGNGYWKLIFSFLGIDNYLPFFHMDSFYLVGEWFTTIIILIYVIYPLLNKLFNNYFVETSILIFTIYFIFSWIPLFDIPHSENASIFTGTFLFWIGMAFEKYAEIIRKNKFYLIYSFILLCVIIYLGLPIDNLLWQNLAGISLFIILLSTTTVVKGNNSFTKLIVFISSLTYSIYVTHHFIAYFLEEIFSSQVGEVKFPFLFYLFYLYIVIVTSAFIYYIAKELINLFKWIISKFSKAK